MGPPMFISIHTDLLNADKLEKTTSWAVPNLCSGQNTNMLYVSKAESEQQLSKPKNSTPTPKTTVFMSRTPVHTRESLSAKSYFM